jgi:membrane protein YdbS with pleckstrin-like domain
LDVLIRLAFVFIVGIIFLFIVKASYIFILLWLAVFVSGLFVALLRSKFSGYEFLDSEFVIECGTTSTKSDAVPYHKVDSVYVTKNRLEKILRISSLHLHVDETYTLGSDSEQILNCLNRISHEFIVLLPDKDIEQITSMLAKKIEKSRNSPEKIKDPL